MAMFGVERAYFANSLAWLPTTVPARAELDATLHQQCQGPLDEVRRAVWASLAPQPATLQGSLRQLLEAEGFPPESTSPVSPVFYELLATLQAFQGEHNLFVTTQQQAALNRVGCWQTLAVSLYLQLAAYQGRRSEQTVDWMIGKIFFQEQAHGELVKLLEPQSTFWPAYARLRSDYWNNLLLPASALSQASLEEVSLAVQVTLLAMLHLAGRTDLVIPSPVE